MLCLCVQYWELVHLYYLGYYVLATFLLWITLTSAFASTGKMYILRKRLFDSVDKPRLTPMVHVGRVRCSALSCASSLDVWEKTQ